MNNEYISRPLWSPSSERKKDLFWLDKNEITIEESLLFNDYLISQIKSLDLSIYPELGNSYKQLEFIFNIKEENTLLVNGADGGIRAMFLGLPEKFEVITLDPTFAMINIYPKNLSKKLTSIQYEYYNSSTKININKIIKTIAESKDFPFVIIATPDSPTGAILSKDEIKKIIDSVERRNGIFLIDATYALFNGLDYLLEIIELIKKSKSCVLTSSFSKFPGLAGARLGFLTGSQLIINQIRNMRPMYEIGALQSRILESVLLEWSSCLNIIEKIRGNKKELEQILNRYSPEILTTYGNFTLFRSNKILDSSLETLCYYRKSFSCNCLKDFSRLSTPPKEFLNKLKLILKS